MRTTYVMRDGKLVEKQAAAPRGGYVISDDAVIRSQFDGKVYTSKSRYRAELRARGLIEVGNETPRPVRGPEPDPARAFQKAWGQLYGD